MPDPKYPFQNRNIEAVFHGSPGPARGHLLRLRELIFDTAATTPGVGDLEEALRWGQPAYLTRRPRSGSTIRLGVPAPGKVAIYVHCRTTLIAVFRQHFPNGLEYDGNRAVHMADDRPLPLDRIAHLVRAALTYHRK